MRRTCGGRSGRSAGERASTSCGRRRELRHTLVSLLSDNGMAIEEISRLVGHSSSNVTETVYRHQIRPVITIGAEAIDKLFANEH
jgi:integrase